MLGNMQRVAVVAVAVLALTGCGSGADPAPEPTAAASESAAKDARPRDAGSEESPEQAVPAEDGGPLVALPDCKQPPSAVPADVPGLILPDDAVVTSVKQDGPLMIVRGYVEQTPIEVREFYQEQPGLDFSELEDEVYEAEALYTEGAFRSYAKAQAICKTGSDLLVVVGSSGESGVPEPSGE